MIQPQELRIGNYYQGASRGNIETVTWQTLRDLEEGKLNCLPIQLTEEMHNKFGVYKNGFNNFEYELPIKNNFSIKIIFSGDYVFLRQSNSHNIHEDDVVSVWNKDLTKRDMYINEFQNLYFALTGEELTFKK
jgi:hypothetical protein